MKEILLAIVLAVLVASCGVKNDPKSPSDSDYPRTYPTKQ